MKHSTQIPCPRCEDKLERANSILVSWFEFVKQKHPTAHIAWSFRDEKDQNDSYERKLSTLKWPNSKHNYTDEAGKPLSKALDLFQLDEDGRAQFKEAWYYQLYKEILEINAPIKWGGTFKFFKDLDHFEIMEDIT